MTSRYLSARGYKQACAPKFHLAIFSLTLLLPSALQQPPETGRGGSRKGSIAPLFLPRVRRDYFAITVLTVIPDVLADKFAHGGVSSNFIDAE